MMIIGWEGLEATVNILQRAKSRYIGQNKDILDKINNVVNEDLSPFFGCGTLTDMLPGRINYCFTKEN